MFAPLFDVVSTSSAVKALLGSGVPGDPLRVYPFGLAPNNVVLPYVVWQNIGGAPLNYLSGTPDTDNFDIQVDVYSNSAESVRAVVGALNTALENVAYITRWGNESISPQTLRHHYGFDVEFYTHR